jgi:hypothetical protein
MTAPEQTDLEPVYRRVDDALARADELFAAFQTCPADADDERRDQLWEDWLAAEGDYEAAQAARRAAESRARRAARIAAELLTGKAGA